MQPLVPHYKHIVDFTTQTAGSGTLDSTVQLLRASPATVQTGFSTIVSGGIGNNVARIGRRNNSDQLGLVIEEQRINFALNNRNFTGNIGGAALQWNGGGATITLNYGTGPDGRTSVGMHASGTNTYSRYVNLQFPSSGTYNFSEWAQPITLSSSFIEVADHVGSITCVPQLLLSSSGQTNWQRISMSFNVLQNDTLFTDNNIIWCDDRFEAGLPQGFDIGIDYPQIESGSFGTEAISTDLISTNLTRSADHFYANDVTQWVHNGALSLEFQLKPKGASGSYGHNLQLFFLDANNQAYITQSTQQVVCIVGGTSSLLPGPVKWNQFDNLTLYLQCGGGIQPTRGYFSTNGGVQCHLGQGKILPSMSSLTGTMDLLCSGTLNVFTSWCYKIIAHQYGALPWDPSLLGNAVSASNGSLCLWLEASTGVGLNPSNFRAQTWQDLSPLQSVWGPLSVVNSPLANTYINLNPANPALIFSQSIPVLVTSPSNQYLFQRSGVTWAAVFSTNNTGSTPGANPINSYNSLFSDDLGNLYSSLGVDSGSVCAVIYDNGGVNNWVKLPAKKNVADGNPHWTIFTFGPWASPVGSTTATASIYTDNPYIPEVTGVFGVNNGFEGFSLIGNGYSGAVNVFNGNIAEVIAFSGVLSQDDRIRLGNYWTNKYEITFSSSFNPNNYGNCFCWFTAGQGITLSGSSVTKWTDSSGNGIATFLSGVVMPGLYLPPTYTGSSPNLNNFPSVIFNGSQEMSSSGWTQTLKQPSTWYIVAYNTSSVTSAQILTDGIDGTNRQQIGTDGGSGNNLFRAYSGGATQLDGHLHLQGEVAEILAYSGSHSYGTRQLIMQQLGIKYNIKVISDSIL